MKTQEEISALVGAELAKIEDSRVKTRITELLVSPYTSARDWDYGKPGQKFTCWMVLEHPESKTGIAYCEEGFGPRDPWGLLFLEGPHLSMGMDSSWYDSLEAVFRESWAFESLRSSQR